MGHRNIATDRVHEISAHERLADAVPIADLVTATRKRASGKGVGKSVGTLTESLGQTPTKTGSDRQTGANQEIQVSALNGET